MKVRKLFGRLAVEKGYVTEEQVLRALRRQYNAKVVLRRHLFLGEILILQGLLTPRQLRELLDETGEYHEEPEDSYEKRFFGTVAIEKGFVTHSQVLAALDRQREDDAKGERHRLLGEVLYAEGKLTRSQVEAVVNDLVTALQEIPPE